jgi:hypothetical protein
MRSGVSSLRALIGNVTEPPGHISRMRRYDGMFRLPGAFFRHEFSADYTISMIGFDFRSAEDRFCRPTSSKLLFSIHIFILVLYPLERVDILHPSS